MQAPHRSQYGGHNCPASLYNDPAASSSRNASLSGQGSSSRQHPVASASEQLQSYIDHFERSQTPTPVAAFTDSLVPRQHSAHTDDAWDLLCGGSRHYGGTHVSVKTHCILRDVDRRMGHLEPCYASPEKLDLRSLWPSMHEHLERRWRRQLRERYEERQRMESAAKAAAASASAGAASRADMYKYGWLSSGYARRRNPHSTPSQPAQRGTSRLDGTARVLVDRDREDDAEKSSSASDSDSSTVEVATAIAARSSDERLWGSDSGLGLSCNGASAAIATAQAATGAEAAAVRKGSFTADDPETADHRVGDDDGASFEERMRSYRCVLEAHEMSTRLRQHLEAACATVGNGGKRVLSVEDKGRIRDRLARLQGPLKGGFALPEDEEQRLKDQQKRLQEEQEAERITTERLSRLMNSARSLLAKRDGDAADDPSWLGNLSESQEQSEQQLEPQSLVRTADLETNHDPSQS